MLTGNLVRVRISKSRVIPLYIGRDDPNFASSEQLSAALAAKGIPHRFYPWDGWAHDWPYWERMAQLYL